MLLKVVLEDELFIANDCASGAIRSGAALELGQRSVNLGRFQDLFQSVIISELRVGVVDRVSVVLFSDFSEVLGLGSKLLHMLDACVSKKLRSEGTLAVSSDFNVFYEKLLHRVSSISEESLQ